MSFHGVPTSATALRNTFQIGWHWHVGSLFREVPPTCRQQRWHSISSFSHRPPTEQSTFRFMYVHYCAISSIGPEVMCAGIPERLAHHPAAQKCDESSWLECYADVQRFPRQLYVKSESGFIFSPTTLRTLMGSLQHAFVAVKRKRRGTWVSSSACSFSAWWPVHAGLQECIWLPWGFSFSFVWV